MNEVTIQEENWTATIVDENVFVATIGIQGPPGADGPAGADGAPGPNQLLSGSILYVDSIYGNDSTGTRGDAAKPFLTLVAAIAASQTAGTDLIYVHSGSSYYDPGDASTILPSNVDLIFCSQATITPSTSGLYDDSQGSGVNRIIGDGVIGGGKIATVYGGNLVLQSRVIYFNGQDAVVQRNGTLNISAKYATGNVCNWYGGRCELDFGYIDGTFTDSPAIVLGSNAETPSVGDLYLTVGSMTSQAGNGTATITSYTVDSESRAWVRAFSIYNANVNERVINYGGFRFYVEAEKTKGTLAGDIAGGEFYLRTQKHNGVVINSAATAYLNIDLIDDTGVATIDTNIVTVSGGEVTITGAKFTGSDTTLGILVTGGTLRLVNCVIDTTANSSTSPITFTGGTITLDNCTLIANGSTATITGSGGTVTIRGTITYNTAVSGVTLSYTGVNTGNAKTADSATTATTATNANASNNLLNGYTTTVTAAGTTTLTVGSTHQQFFTGTLAQICKLPVTSTLTLGQSYRVVNNSTGLVTVNSSGNNAVVALVTGTSAIVTCIATTGTTAASWSVAYLGTAVARVADGGTGLSTLTSGALIYASGTTTMASTATVRIVGGRLSDAGPNGNLNEVYGSGAGAALNSSANFNCLFGYQSGKAITAATQNVCIGYQAGVTITTGTSNTIIGYQSDVATNAIGSVVCIGASLIASGSSSVLIGSSLAAGANSVSVGNSNTGAHTNGVCIGTSIGMSTVDSSIAIGRGVTISHNSAIAMGQNATSSGAGTMTIGWYNIATVGNYFQSATDTTPSGVVSGRVQSTWATNTHASRKGRVTIEAADASGYREGVRVGSNGSAALLGFYGATEVAKQTVTGSRGGNAALASALTAFASLGIITDSTTV